MSDTAWLIIWSYLIKQTKQSNVFQDPSVVCPTNYAQTSERESKAIELRDKAERVQRSDQLEDLSKKDKY